MTKPIGLNIHPIFFGILRISNIVYKLGSRCCTFSRQGIINHFYQIHLLHNVVSTWFWYFFLISHTWRQRENMIDEMKNILIFYEVNFDSISIQVLNLYFERNFFAEYIYIYRIFTLKIKINLKIIFFWFVDIHFFFIFYQILLFCSFRFDLWFFSLFINITYNRNQTHEWQICIIKRHFSGYGDYNFIFLYTNIIQCLQLYTTCSNQETFFFLQKNNKYIQQKLPHFVKFFWWYSINETTK